MFRVRPAHWRVIAPFLLDMPSSCWLLSSGVGRLGEVPSDAVRSFTMAAHSAFPGQAARVSGVCPACSHSQTQWSRQWRGEGGTEAPTRPRGGGRGTWPRSSGVLRPRSLLSLHPPPLTSLIRSSRSVCSAEITQREPGPQSQAEELASDREASGECCPGPPLPWPPLPHIRMSCVAWRVDLR